MQEQVIDKVRRRLDHEAPEPCGTVPTHRHYVIAWICCEAALSKSTKGLEGLNHHVEYKRRLLVQLVAQPRDDNELTAV